VLVLLMLAGALIRHFFVARHKTEVAGTAPPWEWAVAGVVVLLGVAVWLKPEPAPVVAAKEAGPSFVQVQRIVEQRCQMCHNAQLSNKGVMLHTPELIKQHAQQIYQQAVVLKNMPMNNATQITDAERALLGQWYEAGGH
jgi:uncharacterized membrane protein